MYKLKNPYFIVRKPSNLPEVKFSFVNNNDNKIVFQTLMRDQKDFSSINLNTLEKHFNYSYYFSVRKSNKWVKATKSILVIPEFINDFNEVEFTFNKHHQSNKLLVVFSSSTSVQNIYNYYRTLSNVKCNKLFLADESFSEDKTTCSYFMGQNKNMNYEKKIIDIINYISRENDISKQNIVAIGSSKGGFASLYYTYKYKFGTSIVGSPTIKLGTQHKDNDFGKMVIKNLAGSTNQSDISWLDNLILDQCSRSDFCPNIYYHAGINESRYLEQGTQFLDMLKERNLGKIDINLGPYESHKEVVNFYPRYLIDILESNILKCK